MAPSTSCLAVRSSHCVASTIIPDSRRASRVTCHDVEVVLLILLSTPSAASVCVTPLKCCATLPCSACAEAVAGDTAHAGPGAPPL